MKKKLTPAQKANRTRQTQKNLDKKYGYLTSDVVMAKLRDQKTRLDNLRMLFGTGTVAAVLANLSRGTYDSCIK